MSGVGLYDEPDDRPVGVFGHLVVGILLAMFVVLVILSVVEMLGGPV